MKLALRAVTETRAKPFWTGKCKRSGTKTLSEHSPFQIYGKKNSILICDDDFLS